MNELKILISADLDQNKSVTAINKSIKELEKKIQKLKLQATIDNEKSKSAISKEIEKLNKQKRQLYVDLNLRKDALKKQYRELEKESNLSLNVDTTTAQRQIKNVSHAMGDTKNETIGLGLALKNAFSNAGLVISAQSALNLVRQAANEAIKAIKEYDEYAKNLKIITNKDDVSDLIADYATKSIDMKINISEYEQASEVILRAGKNLAESAEYTDTAIKLAKTGFIETDAAAENLIVIANSYDLTADKLKNITDALLTFDVQTNTEAGSLSSAMAKSAKNAQLAGLSYEQLGATIAKLKDTTGKSEAEIATSLNNIFNRTYRVKPNAFIFENENGETEDLTKPLSDVEKVVNQLGISIRKSATEFKDFEEIISAIAPIWKDLDSVSQNAISSVFAGQHKNVFLNLVKDWQDIVELTKTAENSLGATEQKYEAYLDSLEAKSAEFSTVSKELWNHLIPESFVGDLTEAGTATVKFVDDYKVLQSVLKSAVFYGLAKGAIAAKNSLVGMANDIKNVSYAMDLASKGSSLTSQQFNALGLSLKGLSDKQQKLILSTKSLTEVDRINLLQLTGLSEVEAKTKLQTLGLAQANQQATTATFSLSGSMKALFATLSANPILVLTAAFTAFTAIQQKVQRENEEMRKSAVEDIEKYNEQSKALEDLREKYIDICDSEDSTSKKTEQLNEWKKTLIETYGLEKEAIEQVNTAREDGLKLIDDEIIKNKINNAETWLTDHKKAYEDAQKKLLGANNSAETAVIPKANIVMNIDKSALDDYSENFDDIIKQLTIKNPTKNNPLAQIKIQGSNMLQQYENLSKILNDITSLEVTKGLNKSEQELYDALLKKQAEYKKVITDDMKDIVEKGKNYTSMIQLFNFETDGINFENVSADTYKEFRDKFLQSLGYGYKKDSRDFSLDIEKTLLDMLPDLENSYRGIEITDIVDTSDSDTVTDDIGNVTSSLDNLTDKYNKLSKSVETYTKSQKTLTSALEEQEKHGQLSASTIQSLIDAGYSQALVTDKETGAVTLNVRAYERLNKVQKEKIVLEAQQQKSELEEKFKEEQKAISDLTTEMRYANQERREAIMLEMQQHGLTMSDITEEMSKLDASISSLSSPEFDTGSNSDKPQQVLNYERWVTEQEHKIVTGQREEDKAYYDEKLKRAEIAYSGLADYESDLWKVREEVYKWQNEQEDKLFDKKIDNYDKLKDKALDDNDFDNARSQVNGAISATQSRISELQSSGKVGIDDELEELYEQLESLNKELDEIDSKEIDFRTDKLDDVLNDLDEYAEKLDETFTASDGTKLTSQEKWQAIVDVYKEAQIHIQEEIDRILDMGIEGHEEQVKQLEEQIEEYGNKISDAFRSAVEEEKDYWENVKDTVSDSYDERIDKIKEQQSAAEKAADVEIDAIQGKIDALNEANEAKEEEINLEKLRRQTGMKTRMTYGADGTVEYKQDPEAKQEYEKALLEHQVDILESQKDDLEKSKDIQSKGFDSIIEDLESQKEQDERQFDILIQRLDDYLNPDSSTSNNEVWSELAKMDGASYRNGKWVDKNGDTIDINALVKKTEQLNGNDKVNNSSDNADSDNTTEINNFIKKISDVVQNNSRDKFAENVEKLFGVSREKSLAAWDKYADIMPMFNPVQEMLRKTAESITNNDNRIINHNDSVANFSIGEIVVNNPVDTNQLVRDVQGEIFKKAMLEIPNAFQKELYSNLK